MDNEDGGPAFPFEYETAHHLGIEGMTERVPHTGMSLRDWFAGQAMGSMAGALAEESTGDPDMDAAGIIHNDPQSVAEIAYVYADAMLAARAKTPQLKEGE